MYFSTVSFLSIFVLVATSVAFAQHPNTKFQSYYVEGACECVDITLDDGNSGENQIKSNINYKFHFQESMLGTASLVSMAAIFVM